MRRPAKSVADDVRSRRQRPARWKSVTAARTSHKRINELAPNNQNEKARTHHVDKHRSVRQLTTKGQSKGRPRRCVTEPIQIRSPTPPLVGRRPHTHTHAQTPKRLLPSCASPPLPRGGLRRALPAGFPEPGGDIISASHAARARFTSHPDERGYLTSAPRGEEDAAARSALRQRRDGPCQP